MTTKYFCRKPAKVVDFISSIFKPTIVFSSPKIAFSGNYMGHFFTATTGEIVSGMVLMLTEHFP